MLRLCLVPLQLALLGLPETAPPEVDLSTEKIERVGDGVSEPIEVSRVRPVYPEAARLERVSGVVLVEAVITKDGTVANAKVLRPLDSRLDIAALEAVRQWKYLPATKKGRPVPVYLTVTVTFKLTPDGPSGPPIPVVGTWHSSAGSAWVVLLQSGLAFQCRVLSAGKVLRSTGVHSGFAVDWRQHWAAGPVSSSGSTLLLGSTEAGLLLERTSDPIPAECRSPF